MATPRADTYNAASGVGVYAGMSAPSVLPDWLDGQPLNTWIAIQNTAGAGGNDVDNAGGFGRLGNVLVSAAQGGAQGSSNNQVVSIDLGADAPAWALRKAGSPNPVQNTAYYPDGTPTTRHTFHSIFGISGNRVMLAGVRFANGPSSFMFQAVDAFDMTPGVYQWIGNTPGAPGLTGSGFADVSPAGYYPTAQDGNGDLYCFQNSGEVGKYTVATNTWSVHFPTGPGPRAARYPNAWDSKRDQFFSFSIGDGEGVGTTLRCFTTKPYSSPMVQADITFNASAAATALVAAQPSYASMDYDPVNDQFLFYANNLNGVVYAIKPNAGNAWDVSVLAAAGSLPASTMRMVKKFFYMPALKGFVCLPQQSNNLHFLRTA